MRAQSCAARTKSLLPARSTPSTEEPDQPMSTKPRRSTPVIPTCLRVLLAFASVRAGQPVLWETSGRAELLKGDARGVSISDTGVLMLSPKLNEVFNTQQTYVWSTAI